MLDVNADTRILVRPRVVRGVASQRNIEWELLLGYNRKIVLKGLACYDDKAPETTLGRTANHAIKQSFEYLTQESVRLGRDAADVKSVAGLK